MMKSVIVFGSRYGTAEKYAKVLSERLEIPCVDYRKWEAERYDAILYVGSLYAGNARGLAKTLKRPFVEDAKKILIITVGLADPKDQKNLERIEKNLYRQLPEKLHTKVENFHVRGKLDYPSLNLKHRTMMKFLYYALKRKPEEEQNEEMKAFIANYDRSVDFVDFDALDPAIERYSRLMEEYEQRSEK